MYDNVMVVAVFHTAGSVIRYHYHWCVPHNLLLLSETSECKCLFSESRVSKLLLVCARGVEQKKLPINNGDDFLLIHKESGRSSS